MVKIYAKLIFIFLAVCICLNGFAQTAEQAEKTETTPLSSHKRLKPGKVALLALVPGAGQIYNKKYWKVPIIYALAGGLVYSVIFNDTEFQKYNRAIKLRRDSVTANSHEAMQPMPQAGLENYSNYYHKYRDLSAIGILAVYTLSIVDAYVDAHLMEFDVNDKLSLKVNPDMQYTYASGITPGLSLTLQFK